MPNTNVVFIDSRVVDYEDIVKSVNSVTVPIVYGRNTSKTAVLNTLRTQFTNIQNIAVVSYSQSMFLEGESFFTEANKLFIINVIKEFNVENIHYLACNSLEDPMWVEYYETIKRNTSVVVGASNDKTGNLQYGGNWEMENISKNIETVYFMKSIEVYKYLLDMGQFTCIVIGGKVYGCGFNGSGQLGDDTTTNRSVFVPMIMPSGKTAASVYSSYANTIVKMTDGTVFICGGNYNGQLGNGTTTDSITLVPMTMPVGKFFSSASLNNNKVSILMTDGTVYSCGNNDYGQLGDDTTTNRSVFVPMIMPSGKTAASVYSGAFLTVVMMTDGTVYSCGIGIVGTLGNGTTTNSSTLVPMIIPSGKTVASIDTGFYPHTVITMTDGTVYSCGYNNRGQLGDGTNTSRHTLVPMIMPLNKTAATVSCGYSHTVVRMTDGTVFSCGNNSNGQLGDNTTANRTTLVPMLLPPGKTASKVLCGQYHTVITMTDGTVFSCGLNSSGQLGDGTLIQRNTLVQIYIITDTSVSNIVPMYNAGVPLSRMILSGITISQMIAENITIAQMYSGGITVAQILAGGITVAQMYSGGITPVQMYSGGITPAQMLNNGITITQMLGANILFDKLGGDIDGEGGGDESGTSVSLSGDGTIVAIGAIYNGGINGEYSGHVRVYKYTSGSWSQLGLDIDGEAAWDQSGKSVFLSSDGLTVAIGAGANTGYSGHVRVYKYNSVTNVWTQLGLDIDGEAAWDQSGTSVSLSSDGLTVAIGARYNTGINGQNSGHVRVYKYINSVWTQLGLDIDGEAANDQSGISVSLSSDGSTVAIGAAYNYGVNGYNGGHVRVYKYTSGSWSQLGLDIDGETTYDNSGWSVSLSSDGLTVAIGANSNDGPNAGINLSDNRGHVRVYKYINNVWTKLGGDIDGEAEADYFGTSVSLSSDGLTVAIGAIYNDGTSGTDSGHVRVYKYNSVINGWSQLGLDIDGEAANNQSGTSVFLSSDGTTVAIGAPANTGYKGHVRVYKILSGSYVPYGVDLDKLKAAGYTATDLKAEGYTATDLKAAGYLATDLKAAGYLATDLKAAGYTATNLRDAGYTQQNITDAGYSQTTITSLTNFGDLTKTVADRSFQSTEPSSNNRGLFSYTSSDTTVATVFSKRGIIIVTILKAGTTVITATQAETETYYGATISCTLTVISKVESSLAIGVLGAKTYGDAPFEVLVTTNSTGSKTYSSSNPSVATVSSSGSVTILGAGTTTVTVVQLKDANYFEKTVTSVLTVNPSSASNPTVITGGSGLSYFLSTSAANASLSSNISLPSGKLVSSGGKKSIKASKRLTIKKG